MIDRGVALILGAFLVVGPASTRAEAPTTVPGLWNPRAAIAGPAGVVLVSEAGRPGRAGDGMIAAVERTGRILPFVTGMDDPGAMARVGGVLFVADGGRVWRVEPDGTPRLHAGPGSFPRPVSKLDDLTPDGRGGLYLSDQTGRFGVVYRLDPAGRATLILDGLLTSPQVERPGGLLLDDADHLFVADSAWGHLYRYGLRTGTPERVGSGFGAVEGIARGARGRIFLGDGRDGRISEVASDLEPPRSIRGPWRSAGGLGITPDGRTLLVPDPAAGTLTWFPLD